MTFEENPFRVLNVSIYDTKSTIVERADDLSFADPDKEKIFAQARDILINPRKRIAAEVRLFVDADAFSAENIFVELTEIDRMFSIQKPDILRTRINATRIKSKFPAVQDTETIKAELKNLRDELRGIMQEALTAVSHQTKVDFANRLVDKVLTQKTFGVVIEDFFECYKLEMTAFINETIEKILELSELKFDGKAIFSVFLRESEQTITEFVRASRPLDKFSMAIGRNNFDESEKVFYEVRNVAIKLFNEKDLIDYPLKIIHLLEENFSYLSKLDEVINKDIKFLDETKERRPSQTFLSAKAKLDSILADIDKNLHFGKGFERKNLDFYFNLFKPRHEIELLEIMSRKNCKPDEWKILNVIVASIYIQVGNAMTWAQRADLAFEMFQKALPYAEASGDNELITLTRKRVNEWRRIAKRYSDDSGGCLIWIIIIVFIFLCSR